MIEGRVAPPEQTVRGAETLMGLEFKRDELRAPGDAQRLAELHDGLGGLRQEVVGVPEAQPAGVHIFGCSAGRLQFLPGLLRPLQGLAGISCQHVLGASQQFRRGHFRPRVLARRAAAETASITVSVRPPRSSALTPSMVVPAGEQTRLSKRGGMFLGFFGAG